jgi:hypothetical protein
MLKRNIRKLTLIILISLVMVGISSSSCSDSDSSPVISLTQSKASSALLLQISLKQQQLASPVPERLGQMQAQGMNITNLSIQRIYIYLKQPLTQAQVNELQALGITIYLNSWIPPVGNNPDGFYLADMPIDKLDALANKDYVVSLDTAEKQLKPQSDVPQGGLK